VEDETAFPGNGELVVEGSVVEEGLDIVYEGGFGGRGEDYIVPGGGLDGGVKGFVFGPAAVVEDVNFVVGCAGP